MKEFVDMGQASRVTGGIGRGGFSLSQAKGGRRLTEIAILHGGSGRTMQERCVPPASLGNEARYVRPWAGTKSRLCSPGPCPVSENLPF